MPDKQILIGCSYSDSCVAWSNINATFSMGMDQLNAVPLVELDIWLNPHTNQYIIKSANLLIRFWKIITFWHHVVVFFLIV